MAPIKFQSRRSPEDDSTASLSAPSGVVKRRPSRLTRVAGSASRRSTVAARTTKGKKASVRKGAAKAAPLSPSAAKLTLESLCEDIQILILKSITSPRDCLKYISASPIAWRLFCERKEHYIANLISHNLSLRAVQTGVRIDHYHESGKTASLKELGAAGNTVTSPGDYRKLDIKILVTLFRMCTYYEPLVLDCKAQSWFASRVFNLSEAKKRNHGDPWYYGTNAIKHLAYLDRPETELGLSDDARLFGGLFIHEKLMLVCGTTPCRLHPWYTQQELAELFGVSRNRNSWTWHTTDTMVDMSAITIYLEELSNLSSSVRRSKYRGPILWACDRMRKLDNKFNGTPLTPQDANHVKRVTFAPTPYWRYLKGVSDGRSADLYDQREWETCMLSYMHMGMESITNLVIW